MPAPPLTTVAAGDFSAASHHNEITRFLQPLAGDFRDATYDFTWFSSGNNQYFGIWIAMAQRRSVPASLAIATTGAPPPGVGPPANGAIFPDGFKIYFNTTTSSGISNIGIVGSYTVFY